MSDEVKKDLIERNRGNWFIQHIQDHLDKKDTGLKLYKLPPKVVGCCICGKTVDEIAEDFLTEIMKIIQGEPNDGS